MQDGVWCVCVSVSVCVGMGMGVSVSEVDVVFFRGARRGRVKLIV